MKDAADDKGANLTKKDTEDASHQVAHICNMTGNRAG